MKNIILEGIDGGGKSYLSNQLKEDFPTMKSYWSSGPPITYDKVDQALQYQLSMYNTIFDRVTCISEQCYQMDLSFKRQTLLNKYLHMMLDKCIIIHCTALEKPDNSNGFNDKEHNEMVKKNFEEIKKRYDIIMSFVPCIKYNFKVDSYENLIKEIKLLLNWKRRGVI